MLTLLLFTCFAEPTVTPFQSVATYSNPEGDALLRIPYSFDYGHDRLYIVDQGDHKVHMWSSETRAYLGSFGKQGQGPGEMYYPYKVQATEHGVYVWSRIGVLSVFDAAGTYRTSLKAPYRSARNFAVLRQDRLLFGYANYQSATNALMDVVLLNQEGDLMETLKSWPNDMILAPIEGSNKTTIKAYGADLDIQRDPDGSWWLGYAAEPVLYKISVEGKIVDKQRYEIPTAKPNDAEKDAYARASFTAMNGRRASFKDMPKLAIDYSHNKSYFCQFGFLGGKTIFLSHVLGGIQGLSFGFSEGSYQINDRATGKMLKRGTYRYPEDTRILIRNGHILGLISDDEGNLSIQELVLP